MAKKAAPANPLFVLFGNQLFPIDALEEYADATFFLAEDMGLCTYERHHQQKIVLFLAAMRAYADALRERGWTVRYHELDPDDERSYEQRLRETLEDGGHDELVHFEVEDKPAEARLIDLAETLDLPRTELRSPMFGCARARFEEFVDGRSRLRMADFYKEERRRLNILVDADGEPEGGQWSFDADNRKKLPKNIDPPAVPPAPKTAHVRDVIELVADLFGDHPGRAAEFWWPTTRKQARAWLDDFLEQRLACFGPYEDAISQRSRTVFHSVLSPAMNLGLLLPDEVVDAVLGHARQHDVPIQSVEGLVRQIIGWREFVRGVYREFSEQMESSNFWSHERGLTDAWYDGSTGIPPLDDTIETAQRLGWTHHIPRLMVAANMMTLCEIAPRAAHTWFMEMYVDSSEWVMGANVYGMGLFSDGGIFATKPYICGSNYLLKMSDYGKGEWCDAVDGLYWRFIDRHRDFFESNARLALMPKALDRMDAGRRDRIAAAADAFLARHTTAPER